MMCIYIGKIVVTTGKKAIDYIGEPYAVEVEFPDKFEFESIVSDDYNMHYGGGTRRVIEQDSELAKIFVNPDTGWYWSQKYFIAKDCLEAIKKAEFALFPELKDWMVAWTEKAIELYDDEAVIYLG